MPKRLPISRKALRAFSLDQLIELNGLVRQLIQTFREAEKQQASQKKEVIEEKTRDNKTYRLILIRCGKKGCKCAAGPGHGPYWYAFWSEEGRTRCIYIGKKLSQAR